jgi:hypothetical protein
LLTNIVAYRPVAKRDSVNIDRFGASKHVPVAKQQILNNAKIGLNNGNGVFLRGPCRDVISKGQS